MVLKKNETQIVCLAQFYAKEGDEEKLLEKLHSLIPLTLQEGGCIRYELNVSVDDPRKITFIEKFYDQATFDKHCAMPYITSFFKEGKEDPDFVESFEVSLHKQILP